MLEKPGNGKLAKHRECINSVLALRSAIEYWKACSDGNGHAETEQQNNIYAVTL
jgi:hypothetical protein